MSERNERPWPTYKTPLGVSLTVLLYENGFPMQRIAALFDVNQGRIAETIKDIKEYCQPRASEQAKNISGYSPVEAD